VSQTIFSGGVRPDVVAHLLDGELVLFDERQSRLFALNPTASFIWSSLAGGLGARDVALQLSRVTGVTLERASVDIEAVMASWRREHLLDDDPPAEATAAGSHQSRASGPRAVPQGAVFTRVARLMDRGLRIVADADLLGAVETVFGQVFVADHQAREDWPTLTACRDGDRWVLLLDDSVLAACTERSAILPMVYGNAARLIYDAADCFAAAHAAAVAMNGRSALLPAASARGKSTLTAALIAAGYQYCSDDLALLTGPPTRLRPVPMKIGLKSGSWEVLAHLWPKLSSLPSHRRADGQWIKYLDPGRESRAQEDTLPVVAIVFPKFVPTCAAELLPLSRADALTRMAAAGYDLSGKLDRRAVATLVSWFSTMACYELQFADLDEAVALFGDVLR
jgi:hypothetical protein